MDSAAPNVPGCFFWWFIGLFFRIGPWYIPSVIHARAVTYNPVSTFAKKDQLGITLFFKHIRMKSWYKGAIDVHVIITSRATNLISCLS